MRPMLVMFYSYFCFLCSISTAWPSASRNQKALSKPKLCVLIRNHPRRNKTHMENFTPLIGGIPITIDGQMVGGSE